MLAASDRAMRITSRVNAGSDSLPDTHAQLGRLFGRPVPEDVGLLAALGGSACRLLAALGGSACRRLSAI